MAREEVHILLFEPLSTKHTGDVVADITARKLRRNMKKLVYTINIKNEQTIYSTNANWQS